ncbi:MAG: glycosyltransferase family 2 protein [Desulfobulbaceae bacterium]|nr:glycosyltransferase family 2 protein [Candidatus Kapabacteria bacterium]MBS3999748.1 glycosyltransferase family 2 protein [Desulfobulbaceae bacterium]
MKISVVIVTRNRSEDLKFSIHRFLEQTYPNKEIIVIDNASEDNTKEMMKENFPDIKYLRLPDNHDIRGINIGIEMSDGDIIWRTDDDSSPEHNDEFEKVVEIFRNHENIDIITCECINVKDNFEVWNWYPFKHDKTNVPPEGYKSNHLVGVGAAIRRTVYNKIGGFWEWGFEEIDFCTRAIIAGFNIRYFPNLRVMHYASMGGRSNPTRWTKLTRQNVRYIWKNFRFFDALGRTIVVLFLQFFEAMRMRVSLGAIIEGYLSVLPVIIATRRDEYSPIPKDKYYDVTLGISEFRKVAHHIISFFIRKFKKHFKKK